MGSNLPPTRRSGSLPRRSAADRFLANDGLWGAGALAMGIILVIVAIVLHAHFGRVNALCSSGLGQLGQAFSGTVSGDCSLATTAESAVGPLVLFGVLALVLGATFVGLALTRAAGLLGKPRGGTARPQCRHAMSPLIAPKGE